MSAGADGSAVPTYRPLRDEHDGTFARYMQYAFRPSGAFDPDEYDPEDPRRDLGAARALYADDTPVSVYRHYDFDATLRGEVHDVVGVASVATPPEHRHQGYVRELLAAGLREWREDGAAFAALWPFSYPFYERLGYARADDRLQWEAAPGALPRPEDDRGHFERCDADDWAALDAVYADALAAYALRVDRSEQWWRHRVFRGRESDPYVYAYRRDGEPAGYLVYDVEEGDDGAALTVREALARDPGAYAQLLGFLAGHDSQVETVAVPGPADRTPFARLPDPGDAECTLHPGGMLRVVDVRRALASLAYPEAASADLVLAVDDDHAPWNDGRFRLRVADGTATCEPTGADPDAEVPVTTLAQLAVGHRAASDAAATGDLTATAGSVEALDRAFPTEQVYLSTFF